MRRLILYGVRYVAEGGATNDLFEHRCDAVARAARNNCLWREEWGAFRWVWWLLYGFRQKWYVVEETVRVPAPREAGERIE